MPNVHVHLHVANLEKSRGFYERFLGVPPVKEKTGYVKFLPPLAPLNLALSAGAAGTGGTVSHLGVQVDTKDQVVALCQQAKAAGLEVREEMDTDCCFANQDKFWVTDPDGIEWEVYHLNHDLDDEVSAAAANTCCAPVARISLGKRA
jgi:catechol 2,3-dioxygenase-like lactoylglutathione lyase family enzyme